MLVYKLEMNQLQFPKMIDKPPSQGQPLYKGQRPFPQGVLYLEVNSTVDLSVYLSGNLLLHVSQTIIMQLYVVREPSCCFLQHDHEGVHICTYIHVVSIYRSRSAQNNGYISIPCQLIYHSQKNYHFIIFYCKPCSEMSFIYYQQL